MSVPLHHYLPASYLGRFSASDSPVSRSRPLWVSRRGNPAVFKTPAAHLGARQNLYAVDGEAVFSVNYVDAAWGQYEPALPQALDALVRGQEAYIAAQVWLETLVPFVASLFVRRAHFATDFETALGLSAKDEPPGNSNRARLFMFQRLLALVMVSRWVILRADSEDEDCLVSDLAFAPLKVPDHSYPGLAIPLDRQHLLALLPQPTKTLLTKHEGNWVTNVEHVTLSPQAIHAFNRTRRITHKSLLLDGAVLSWVFHVDYGPPADAAADIAGDISRAPSTADRPRVRVASIGHSPAEPDAGDRLRCMELGRSTRCGRRMSPGLPPYQSSHVCDGISHKWMAGAA